MGYPEIHILMQMVPSFYALEIIGMGLWLLGQTENSISWQTRMNSAAMQMIQLRTLRMLLTSSGASCPSHDLIQLGRNCPKLLFKFFDLIWWLSENLQSWQASAKVSTWQRLLQAWLLERLMWRPNPAEPYACLQCQCLCVCHFYSFLIHMTYVYLCTLHVSIYAYYLIYIYIYVCMYIILTYIIARQKDRNRRIQKHGPKPKQCQTA